MYQCLVSVLLTAITLACAHSAYYTRQSNTAPIPDFVTKYAPVLYLDQNEIYFPSDIQAQIDHTSPTLNFTPIAADLSPPDPLLLDNLAQINDLGGCTSFSNCSVYLTSRDNIKDNPEWLYGVAPDPLTHDTLGAKSSAVIVSAREGGIVDAYYMFFYAFNLGNIVLDQELGDHVGDWEHVMIRFVNGEPISVWLSQHDYGEAYTYSTLRLTQSGARPIIYSAKGTHGSYAVSGTHTRIIANQHVEDFTSEGAIWDPILSAYFYTYNALDGSNGNFIPSTTSTPTSWLYFLGRWGDEKYPDSDPRQVNLLNLSVAWKYDSGPTGPWDKDLSRTEVCPAVNNRVCSTTSVLPASSGLSIPVTVKRTGVTATATRAAPTNRTSGSDELARPYMLCVLLASFFSILMS